jgi:hypothetical protein
MHSLISDEPSETSDRSLEKAKPSGHLVKNPTKNSRYASEKKHVDIIPLGRRSP